MARVSRPSGDVSSLTVIPNARHLTPLEYPNKIAAQLQMLLVTVSV